ncbi:MAG: TonB family protein [Staphylococcus sp.]|nr:TonB family protein [Staphylococcus sp.]
MAESQSDNRHRLIALFVTIIFHVAVVVVLLTLYLRYPGSADEVRTWPPVDSSEVLFGGEYVMIGDRPEIAENTGEPAPSAVEAEAVPSPQAEALENAGEPAEPAPVISTERPSPAKVEKKPAPEKTGPTKAELEAAAKAKREEETRQAIAGKVKFGQQGTGGSGAGNAGSPNGNSTVGAVSGSPGFNLKGRTLADWHRPASAPLGTITVRVTVNRQGKVTSASYLSGTGAAAASQSARQSCVAAARRSQFSVDNDAPASQTGTITYNFK